jgi:hypothetical protein
MPQFYTLEEAARILQTSPDELKKMAERNEVRAFRDRGTMRFRGPEIDELARRRGKDSGPELQLGEATRPRPADSPTPKKAPGKGEEGGVFDFKLEDNEQVEIGQELHLETPSGVHKKGGSGRKLSGPKSPTPKPGSDSDVRLVPDGSDVDFQISSDSDVKMVDDSATSHRGQPKRTSGPGSGNSPRPKPKSQLDSPVRMVPLDPKKPASDSDVKMVDSPTESAVTFGQQPPKSPSDSDVRLEGTTPRPGKGGHENILTEEIDLDAELRRAEEASKSRTKSPSKSNIPVLPTTSPFELSEADLDLGPVPKDEQGVTDSSSDFDLTVDGPPSAPVTLSAEESPLSGSSEEEVSLGELNAKGASGINLQDPADSGISLEESGSSEEEIDFELSPEPSKGSTPKPTRSSPLESDSESEFELALDDKHPASDPDSSPVDSDSEFELSMDDSGKPKNSAQDSDSEFELSLDEDAGLAPQDSSPVDSDSEFELTLDDSGGLAPLEEESSSEEGEKDIFETDFEVPALDEESGSQAVALDDEGSSDSSDFDLALGDEDIASEEESGSQVVALEDEGDVDDRAETQARPRRGGAVLEEDSEEVEDLFDLGDEEEGGEAPARRSGVAAPAAPAEWGVLPAAVMLPCVVVMFLVTLMGYELVRRDGTNNPNTVTKAVAGMLGMGGKE